MTSSNISGNYSVAKSKSIFASKTFWGAVFTAIAAIAPIVGEAVDKGAISGVKVAEIVVILSGTAATIIGRVQAEDAVYTPRGLPGPNKEVFRLPET